MAHDVKLALFLGTTPYNTAGVSNAIDTTATGYDLENLPLQTPIGDPLTEHVVETMTVRITGTSKANLRTKLSAVYDFADQVRRFWNGGNPMLGRIMLQVENTGNTYWSNLYNVQVSHDNILAATLANYQTVVTITYERDGFWELVTVEGNAVTMTNPNGTSTGLNIANCNDLTGTSPNVLANYVDIDTSDIVGDVPTPALLRVRNIENVATGDSIVYAGGLASYSAGHSAAAPLFMEGETATGGTNTADATCSGGYKERISVASGAEAELLSWAFSSNVEYYLANWYKIIARWAVATNLGDITFRWKLASGSTVIWEGPQFKLANATNLIQEMGEIPLPPLLNWTGPLNLKLFGQQSKGGALTIDLDYIQLMASNCVIKVNFTVPMEYNEYGHMPYYFSYPNNASARQSGSVYYYDCYTEFCRAIMLSPGLYYRIHFVIQSETAGTAEKDRNSNILIYYRPRYRSIGE